MTKLFPSPLRSNTYQNTIVKKDKFCFKCKKLGEPKVLYQCANCHEVFHLHCLPRPVSDLFEEQMDPYHSISIRDLLAGVPPAKEDVRMLEGYFSERGCYSHDDHVVAT